MPGTQEADGNQAQIRAIAKQLVEAANFELANRQPKPEIPAPLKWGAGIIAGIMSVGASGLLFWMVSTISSTQITVVRIDERQTMNAEQWEQKFKTLEDRMAAIEAQVNRNAEQRGRSLTN